MICPRIRHSFLEYILEDKTLSFFKASLNWANCNKISFSHIRVPIFSPNLEEDDQIDLSLAILSYSQTYYYYYFSNVQSSFLPSNGHAGREEDSNRLHIGIASTIVYLHLLSSNSCDLNSGLIILFKLLGISAFSHFI